VDPQGTARSPESPPWPSRSTSAPERGREAGPSLWSQARQTGQLFPLTGAVRPVGLPSQPSHRSPQPGRFVSGLAKASGELPDSLEAALWTRNLDHRTRSQPEPAQASNGRQIERRVSPVERNVQKGFGSGSRPAQRAWLTRAGRCAALRATRRCGFTAVPRPSAAASASLCFSRNSSTSREILRRVAAESLKTLAVAANVGHLLLKRILRRAIAARYVAARRPVKRIGQDTAVS
jgi:hypothetical protein